MSCKIVQHDLSDLTNVRDASNLEQLWQISDTLTLNVAFKPIVRLEVFKMSGNTNGAETINSLKLGSFDTHSLTPSRIYLYQNDEDVLFSCKFKSNPIDQISIVWKLNGVVQNQGKIPEMPLLFVTVFFGGKIIKFVALLILKASRIITTYFRGRRDRTVTI